MNCKKVVKEITIWLKDYNKSAKTNGFVIGISGGVDSAVVSTLCAMTKLPTTLVMLPIHQFESQNLLADKHCAWLAKKYKNVKCTCVDLTTTFDSFISFLPTNELSCANLRSRLRMAALYNFAGVENKLVAGTGNKIEDYGIGFFTKYGDGGVDLSPIGDLTKTEVFELAKYLKVIDGIQKAKPTDGLWVDSRSDEDQIGATYPELEWAMRVTKRYSLTLDEYEEFTEDYSFSEREDKVMRIYLKRHEANQHKMKMPPICPIDK